MKRQAYFRHSREHQQMGFTLIELLTVIAIIVILAALILSGVNSARARVVDAQVSAEIKGLETALEDFKRDHGDNYPPSSITIYNTQAGWDGDTRSKSLVKQMWSNFDFTKDRSATITSNVSLNGAECLLFFLGGMIDIVDGSPVPRGFSKNPEDPFESFNTTKTRYSSYFQFTGSRIIASRSGRYHYVDPIPGQLTPYWYISSYGGKGYRYKYHSSSQNATSSVADSGHELPSATGSLNGYSYLDTSNTVDMGGATVPANAMFMPYLQAGNYPYALDTGNIKSSHQAWKSNSFQIISPGRDGRYGSGGVYKEGDSNKLSNSDKDNVTNFSSGKLN